MKLLIISISFIFIVFTSCESGKLYEKNIEIKNMMWNYNDTLNFEIDIADTTGIYNLYINFRNTDKYQNSNIWFFIHTTIPNGEIYTDTLNYTIQSPRGDWYGYSLGHIFYRKLPYKIVKFPISGKYTFALEHGMREQIINGVSDVGFRIEHANKQ